MATGSSFVEEARINRITFGVASPQEIIKYAAVEVRTNDTFENQLSNPVPGGLYDAAMGTVNSSYICKTCQQKQEICPGHFGFIKLAEPVENPLYVNEIYNILTTVCFECSRLRVDEDEYNYVLSLPRATRISIIRQALKNTKVCPKCQFIQPTITKNSNNFTYDFGKESLTSSDTTSQSVSVAPAPVAQYQPARKRGEVLLPAHTYHIFKRIPNDILPYLGLMQNKNSTEYTRPEWLILTVVPVGPPSMRPPVSTGIDDSREDDLWWFYSQILETNEKLNAAIAKGNAATISSMRERLTSVVSKLIGGSKSKRGVKSASFVAAKDNKPLRPIPDRLGTKGGFFRKNIMGKRVDNSGRSVIDPDPALNVDEVGIPLEMAERLQVREFVNNYNIERLRQMLRNVEMNKYPMVKTVTDAYGNTKTVMPDNIDQIQLKIGMMLTRQILDSEDYLIFNRQPTLHKGSMMVFKIKVMDKWQTIRFNPNCVTSYNADFDGDEMNLHIPFTIGTQQELQQLAGVAKMIVGPHSAPFFSFIQDTIVGSSLLTASATYIPRRIAMNMLGINPYFSGVMMKPDLQDDLHDYWSGKTVISSLYPPINLQKIANGFNELDPTQDKDEYIVRIQNGKHLTGRLDKKTLGAGAAGSLIHVTYLDYGHEAAKNLISYMQRMVGYWNMHRGISIGMDDCVPDPALAIKIKTLVYARLQEAKELIAKAEAGQIIPPTGVGLITHVENQLKEILGSVTQQAPILILKEIKPETNTLAALINSGSKGKPDNLSQIMASVGQQEIDGKLITLSFGGDRTLPHFEKHDDSPESRGFCIKPYIEGLSPSEFFFHMTSGREGAADTAVKTADSGYTAHKLVKTLEDLHVTYDFTIRTGTYNISSWMYGDNSMNPVRLEEQTLEIVRMNNSAIEGKFGCSGSTFAALNISPGGKGDLAELNSTIAKLIEARDWIRKFSLKFDKNVVSTAMCAVNVGRIIKNFQGTFGIAPEDTKYDLILMHRQMEALIEKLPRYFRNQLADPPLPILPQHQSAVFVLRTLIRSFLSPIRFIRDYHLTQNDHMQILRDIELKFMEAIVAPGEMVGVIAAQSASEPLTQMTLNTFHSAGRAGGASVLSGMPRVKELVDANKAQKNSYMTLYLDADHRYKKDKAEEVRNRIIYLTMSNVVDEAQIIFDPDIKKTTFEEDKKWITEFFKYNLETKVPPNLNGFVIRFVLSRKWMYYEGLTMQKIRLALNRLGYYFVVHTDDNAPDLIVRIYINDGYDTKKPADDLNQVMDHYYAILYQIPVNGIEGINKVTIEESQYVSFNEKTGDIITEKEYYLMTGGTNLREVITVRGIDSSRAYSSNPHDMLDVFGIMVTRQSLLTEFNTVYRGAGSSVSYHHLSTIIGAMTAKGGIAQLSRHGMGKLDKGPITKASFEQTTSHIKWAAYYGLADNMQSTSARVFSNTLVKGGSGLANVYLDKDKYMVTSEKVAQIMDAF